MAKHYGGVGHQWEPGTTVCPLAAKDWEAGLAHDGANCPNCQAWYKAHQAKAQAEEPVAGEPAPVDEPLSVDDAFIRLYRLIKMAHEQIDLLEQGADALSLAESRGRLQGKELQTKLLAEARELSYSRGFDDGYQQGLTEGRAEDKSYFTGLLKGLKQGQEQGYKTAQAQAPKVGTVQVDVMSLPEVQELIREQSRQIVDAEERAYQAEQVAQKRYGVITRLKEELAQAKAKADKRVYEAELGRNKAHEQALKTATAKAMAEGLSIGLGFVKALYPDAQIRVEGDCIVVEVEAEEDAEEELSLSDSLAMLRGLCGVGGG